MQDGVRTPEPPTTYEELAQALQSSFPRMAAGQQRIARLFLDDPEGMAFRSIGEAALLAGVHRSSLVRFATKLGLNGYPDLVRLCRLLMSGQAQLVRRLDHASGLSGAKALLAEVAANDVRNVERTLGRIPDDVWNRCVANLVNSQRVYIVGMRKCHPVAELCGYLLRLVRPGVVVVDAAAGTLVDQIRDMSDNDVLIAISIRRYSRDTVRALQYATECGATTFALTDGPSSPLARIADDSIFADTGSVTVLRSVTAFISIVQALFTAVAIESGAESRDELLTDERLLASFGIYVE